jgi:ribosomal protein S20
MPNKKSSKKDVCKSAERNSRNRKYKSIVKTALVKFLAEKNFASFNELQKKYQSVAGKGVISSKKASRIISKCHNILKQITNQTVSA